MTWLALTDHHDRRLSLRGLGTDKKDAPLLADHADTLLTRGTIMFETHLSEDGRSQVLFGYKTALPNLHSLTFQVIPNDGIALVQVQGDHITHAAVRRTDATRTDVVRVTYSWDSNAKWGRLTLEQPEETRVISVNVATPQPLSLKEVRTLMLGQGDQTFAPDMMFAALSDQIEPIGPMATLLPDTPIATPWGYKGASELCRGDTVLTAKGDVVPILHRVSRTVPARGSFQPIRLRTPYFGLQQDIIVAPDQRFLLDGPEVEYLFARESVLVPARHLLNDLATHFEPSGPTIQYTQLLLPDHDTILAAGVPVESLYIGQMRRNPALLGASMLHHLDRAGLPEHGSPSRDVLRRFEAIHLARQRAA